MSTSLERHQGQLTLPSDLGRNVLAGEVLIRDPVNEYEGNLPSNARDVVFGVIDEPAGGTAGQGTPIRLLRSGERRVRIQDNATVARYDPLSPSSTDAGSLAPNQPDGKICAIALEHILSGGTNQYVQASIDCTSIEVDVEHFFVHDTFPDVSTAGTSFSAPMPFNGRLIGISGTLTGTLTAGTAVLTFEVNNVALTGGSITIEFTGSGPGNVYSNSPIIGNDTGERDHVVKSTTDGGSTGAAGLELAYTFVRIR